MTDIKVKKLKFPESIRKRPGMYIGSTRDPNTIIREIVDNSIDELLNRHATYVKIYIEKDRGIVVDNGRGLPIYKDKDYEDKLITYDLLTSTHTGSKFDQAKSQEITMGLNGVGTKCTNALSDRFFALVNLSKRDLSHTLPWVINESKTKTLPVYCIYFNKGIFQYEKIIEESEIESILEIKLPDNALKTEWKTCIVSYPDSEIFEKVEFEYDKTSLRVTKLFTHEPIYLNDEEITPYNFEDAFDVSYFQNKTFKLEFSTDTTKWTALFGFSKDDFSYNYRGSVNTLTTNEGYHVRLITKLLGRAFSENYSGINPNDIKYGLRLFTLVFCQEPQFNSQNKEKLDWIPSINENEVYTSLLTEFNNLKSSNNSYFKALKQRIIDYKTEIGKLALKDYVKSVVKLGGDSKNTRGLGSEVYDCSIVDRTKAELFVVEGKSAGGTLLRARDAKTQACLPLRGKPLNASKVDDLQKVLENKEMRSFINVIGAGVHPFAQISKARYGKIILMADADPDGKAISAILLGTLSVYLPEVIDAGMVYIADMPLYYQNKSFIWNESDLDRTKPFKRFKGLGEMNPPELKTVGTDPATRKLIQVTNKDIAEAVAIVRSTSKKRDIMVNAKVMEDD